MAAEYSKKTNAELVEILKSRSLPHTGKKADMVSRLQDADNADVGAGGEAKTTAAAGTSGNVDVADDVIDWDDDGAAANPTAVSNQQIDIDPSTTHDLKVSKPGEGAKEEKPTGATEDTQSQEQQQQNGAEAERPTDEPAEDAGEGEAKTAPPVDYSVGLASTDFDAEVAKRKARAEKFGVVDETGSAEAQKVAERAKRFGSGDQEAAGDVKGLDQALSSERPRKRGRGDDGDGHRRDKRRDFSGRGRGRRGGGRPQPRNNGSVEQKSSSASVDPEAMERRRQRFG